MPPDQGRLLRNLQRSRGTESLTRLLLDTRVETLALDGTVLDLGSSRGLGPSYYAHFRSLDRAKVITVDIAREKSPHVVANLEVNLPHVVPRLRFKIDDLLATRNRRMKLGRIYPIGYFATAVKGIG